MALAQKNTSRPDMAMNFNKLFWSPSSVLAVSFLGRVPYRFFFGVLGSLLK